MSNTYCALNVHCVFCTKDRRPLIVDEFEQSLWKYLGGIARQNGMKALSIGGVPDHVLISLPTSISVAKAVQLMKGGSSKWIHDNFPEQRAFAWQRGYGAFSVSTSLIQENVAYIRNQKEHHRRKTFQEEYVSFLRKNWVDYDERYLWK
ncbi:MAG TPA: IS200/IS605 family transposase [Desulfomonilaceae bacterium]|nr:IS200/IS605 family transposase [Desulfomonilaceae bacterium]